MDMCMPLWFERFQKESYRYIIAAFVCALVCSMVRDFIYGTVMLESTYMYYNMYTYCMSNFLLLLMTILGNDVDL